MGGNGRERSAATASSADRDRRAGPAALRWESARSQAEDSAARRPGAGSGSLWNEAAVSGASTGCGGPSQGPPELTSVVYGPQVHE